jgi:hypothetical protein
MRAPYEKALRPRREEIVCVCVSFLSSEQTPNELSVGRDDVLVLELSVGRDDVLVLELSVGRDDVLVLELSVGRDDVLVLARW